MLLRIVFDAKYELISCFNQFAAHLCAFAGQSVVNLKLIYRKLLPERSRRCGTIGLWLAICLPLMLRLSLLQPLLAQAPKNQSQSGMFNSPTERELISEVLDPDLKLSVEQNHSKLLRTRLPVARTSIIDPDILEVTQLGPTDMEVIGLRAGSTDLTIWFGQPDRPIDSSNILRYRVEVVRSTDARRRREMEFQELENMLNEFFPNSAVELVLVSNTLVVRGQARDAEEAANILALVRRESGRFGRNTNATTDVASVAGQNIGYGGRNSYGNVVNMLRVPGEQQVMLKVRVAELTRSALRELGMDFSVTKNSFSLSSTFASGGNLISLMDNDDVSLLMKAVSSNGYSKILAEPNLVTLSGRTASFIAGGQFAVPTAVGLGGVGAATTSFQGFGTQLQFTPTVLDKDRVRLTVAPTFSSLNSQNAVNGIPGLNTRSVHTTVDMREGQWLAIAGLIQDQQEGSKSRLPWIGDLPLGGTLFGTNRVKRDETELLILVSPQLIHPLDSQAAPRLLPGMEVKEPSNPEFYLGNRVEGHPENEYRSTVWPNEVSDARRISRADRSSPQLRKSQRFYIQSPHGFVDER